MFEIPNGSEEIASAHIRAPRCGDSCKPETAARDLFVGRVQRPVADGVANILRPRHRHYRITDDPIGVPIGPLTILAWQAAQHGLNGDEAAAQAVFDEIRTIITELDRLSAPHLERIERQLAIQMSKLQAELSERVKDGEGLRQQIDSIGASICEICGSAEAHIQISFELFVKDLCIVL